MKMCQAHWDELHQAIKDAGMGHLINPDGESLMENTIKPELEGEPAKFDPLISAGMMIYGNAIRVGGMYLMFAKEDGTEYCPICEALLHNQSEWINQATAGCKQHCIEQGLIPPVQ